MTNPIYKQVEYTGTSTTSMEAAVQNAISNAQKESEDISWFEVTETRGRLEEDKSIQWQVTIKIGFSLED